MHDRLSQDGASLVAYTIGRLLEGTVVETAQDHSQATIAPKLNREQTRLDFAGRPARELSNLIRGMYPWPGCRVQLLDETNTTKARLTLARVRPIKGAGPRWKPGVITSDGTLSVGDGSEAIEVIDLQPEGKSVMNLSAYRNGHPWLAGMVLQSVVS